MAETLSLFFVQQNTSIKIGGFLQPKSLRIHRGELGFYQPVGQLILNPSNKIKATKRKKKN